MFTGFVDLKKYYPVFNINRNIAIDKELKLHGHNESRSVYQTAK